jgi:hypothetical protein
MTVLARASSSRLTDHPPTTLCNGCTVWSHISCSVFVPCWSHRLVLERRWGIYFITITVLDIYRLSCLLFKTQRFGDLLQSPSSGGTHSVGPVNPTNLCTCTVSWITGCLFIEAHFHQSVTKIKCHILTSCSFWGLLHMNTEGEFKLHVVTNLL